MKTAITEMCGIEHPIIQGGMHYVGFAELAAAVSNAGGLGTITGLTQKTAGDLANEIARCKDMTDKPFAVNLTFLPTLNPPDYPAYVKAKTQALRSSINAPRCVMHSRHNRLAVMPSPWTVLNAAVIPAKMIFPI